MLCATPPSVRPYNDLYRHLLPHRVLCLRSIHSICRRGTSRPGHSHSDAFDCAVVRYCVTAGALSISTGALTEHYAKDKLALEATHIATVLSDILQRGGPCDVRVRRREGGTAWDLATASAVFGATCLSSSRRDSCLSREHRAAMLTMSSTVASSCIVMARSIPILADSRASLMRPSCGPADERLARESENVLPRALSTEACSASSAIPVVTGGCPTNDTSLFMGRRPDRLFRRLRA